jgi:hypothetical protein
MGDPNINKRRKLARRKIDHLLRRYFGQLMGQVRNDPAGFLGRVLAKAKESVTSLTRKNPTS